MDTAIKTAAGLIDTLGTYARVIILGVWVPGFLLFCELGSIYFLYFGSGQEGLFDYLAERLKEFDSAIISALLLVFVLGSAIALGYVARDLAFSVSDFWLRRGWPPTRRLTMIYAEIRRLYGDDAVDKVTANYSVFKLARGDVEARSLPRMPEAYVREFCKQWLKLNLPALNTEGLEIEINKVMGLVIPVALASLVFLSFIGGLLGVSLALVSIAAAVFMMYRVNWARTMETEQALVNFLFAHWHKGSFQAAFPL
jgi:hypothetical protein